MQRRRDRVGAPRRLVDGLRDARAEAYSRRVARRLCLAACLTAEALVCSTMASLKAQNPPGRRDTSGTAPGALTLVGIVTDASGAAVPAAVVALIGTADTTVTDDSGRFVLRGPRSGAYMLSVRRLGFEPQRLAVSVSSERAARRHGDSDPRGARITDGHDHGRRTAGVSRRRLRHPHARRVGILPDLRSNPSEAGDGVWGLAEGCAWPGAPAPPPPARPGWTVNSKRSGCVSYVVDGKPQAVFTPRVASAAPPGQQLGPGTRVGTVLDQGSPDEVIDAQNVGAIEVLRVLGATGTIRIERMCAGGRLDPNSFGAACEPCSPRRQHGNQQRTQGASCATS